MVQNAFGVLKLSFWKLCCTTKLDVKLLPNVAIVCSLLHNVVLG